MNSETLIVFGSTSSIAKALLPDLNFEPNQIFSFDRVNPNQETNQYIPKVNQCYLDWGNLEEIEKSEMNYLLLCTKNGTFLTDIKYFFLIIRNILFRSARSA